MNTFELRYKEQLELLSAYAIDVITGFLSSDFTKDYVSIQLQDVATVDDEYVELYGCYDMSTEEVSDYDNNGGLWLYCSKEGLKRALGL